MENIAEARQAIDSSKNIYLIPGETPESSASALALFYTLKEMGKNVNIVLESLPESLKFLSPSLDFISYPKNFIISVPNSAAAISQVYYEKNDESLKIHLTIEKGRVKKDDISFYYSETKPDLIITSGIKDYAEHLKNKLNSFGFLMESPILNIDNKTDNKNFGKINIIEDQKPQSQIICSILEPKGKEASKCLLAELVAFTENFRKNVTADVFSLASQLMKNGADLKEITDNLKI